MKQLFLIQSFVTQEEFFASPASVHSSKTADRNNPMFDRSVTRLKLKNNQELHQIYKPAQISLAKRRYNLSSVYYAYFEII